MLVASSVNMSLNSLLEKIGFEEHMEKFMDKNITYDKVRNLSYTDIKNILPASEVERFWKAHRAYFLAQNENALAHSKLANITETSKCSSFITNSVQSTHPLEELSNREPRTNTIFVIENIDIHQILDSTLEGKTILNWYSNKGSLTPAKRNKIVHLLMCVVLRLCNRELSENDYIILRDKITREFKTEIGCIYYSPSVPKNKSLTGKAIKAAGKLLNKNGNLKKASAGFYKPTRTAAHKLEEEENEIVSEDIQISIEWLQTLEEPWDAAKLHWRNTYDYRHKDADPKKLISSSYEEWPILKCPLAHELFEIDFSLSNLCAIEKPIDKFSNFYAEISKVRNVPNEDLCNTLKEHLDNIDLDADTQLYIKLMLMSFMFASKARIKQGPKKFWKPSCLESFEGIIVHIQIYGDLKKIKEDRQLFARSKHITLQPYIIAVGEEDLKVESSYLIIDNYEYEMPSLARAIDYCFKSFHSLSAEYPPQSAHLWLLLQQGIYRFRTRWDPLGLGVEEILNDMKISLPPLTKECLKRKAKSDN